MIFINLLSMFSLLLLVTAQLFHKVVGGCLAGWVGEWQQHGRLFLIKTLIFTFASLPNYERQLPSVLPFCYVLPSSRRLEKLAILLNSTQTAVSLQGDFICVRLRLA